MKVSRKIMSVFMSFALAVGLCPGAAYADSLVGVDLQATSMAGETEAALPVDASDGILQNGGLIREAPTQMGPTFGAQSVPDYEGFEEALLAAAENWDGETESVRVDVSGCNVYKDQLKSLFRYFLNNNGQLFYVSSAYSYYAYSSESNAQVSAIVLRFDTSYDSDDLTVFSSSVDNALSGIEQNWTEEQKALYLHDWLATHCEYDRTYNKHSAYNALVEGSAVCQGYALAYDYLLKRAGVECDVITSELINHAWNLATIDGTTYYVDCTWDDPSNIEFEAYCAHGYFLRSKSAFGHIGQAEGEQKTSDGSIANDWLDSSGANVYENTSIGSSTSYDSAYWIDTITAIPNVGSLWAYVDSKVVDRGEAATIKVHDYAAGENRTLATIQPGIWRPWDNPNAYWMTRYTNLVSNGEAFLATTPSSLVKITPAGATSTARELTNAEAAAGFIYGLTYDPETETCRYELGTESTEERTGSGTFDFPPINTTRITTATVAVAPQVYAGTALTPVVSVTLDGRTLDPETDYSIVYPSSCINAGDYKITVVGKGDYRGKASGTFTISPKPVTVSAQPASKTFGEDDPQLEATVEGLLDGDALDYSLSREPGEDVGEYAITASGAALQGNYEVAYNPDTFKIDTASLSQGAAISIDGTHTYTGSALRPRPTVKIGFATLEESTDYTLAYTNNVDAGRATVTITGKGNCTGKASIDFTITPASIDKAPLVLSASNLVYNGHVQKPTVKTVGGKALKAGVDYTVAYSNPAAKSVGTFTVRVFGTGNYSGTASASYVIKPASITTAAITGIATKTYTGKAIAQTPVVKFGATTLRKGTDYGLSFRGNTKAGTNTASVTISGKGNFTGSVTKKFSIAKAANPMSVAAKAPSIKAKKKKATTVKGGAAFKFKKKAVGAVTYKRIAKGSAKWLPKVNAKTGAITVKAGTRKGTYKIQVKVSAKGNANYKAASKTLTIKVKVK